MSWKTPSLFDKDQGTIQIPVHSRVRSVEVIAIDGKEYVQIFLEEKPLETKTLASVAVER